MTRTTKQKYLVKFIVNNLKEEEEMIKVAKKEAKWLKKGGYFFTLPKKGRKIHYEPEDYLKKTKKIEKQWRKQEKQFFSALETFFGRKFRGKVKAHITKYGSGGKYFLPGYIVININSPFNPIATAQHEILHLFVEPFIRKYKIRQEEKEKLVCCLVDLFKRALYRRR